MGIYEDSDDMKGLVEYIKTHSKCYISTISKLLTNNILDKTNKYQLSVKELIFRIRYNIPLDKEFRCSFCGKKIKFNSKCGYNKHCSTQCSTLDKSVQEKKKQTCMTLYGKEYYSNTEKHKNFLKINAKIFHDKAKETSINKYGVDNYAKTDACKLKVKKANEKKFGVDNYAKTQEFKQFLKQNKEQIQNKRKQTCLRKYGTESYTQTDEYKKKHDQIQAKIKNTSMKRFGTKNFSQTPKFKKYVKEHSDEILSKRLQTNKTRFGADWYMQTQEYKDRAKQTCLNKYGVDCYVKTKEYKEKAYNTKKKNNSFNISKPEEQVYQLLIIKFSKDDIIRQYRSKKYPFACDFYIKSLNLYIEYNGMWTHGWLSDKCLGSFNKNNPEHIKVLNYWQEKAKTSKFFKKALVCWTDLDVRKLETFKKNKLNYKIFWNIKEVEDWLGGI